MTIFLEIAQKILFGALPLVEEQPMIWGQQEILLNHLQRQICNVNLNTSRANVLVQRENSIPEDVEMADSFQVGDQVKLIGLPDWLLHELPESEKIQMLRFVGQFAEIREIDAYGYVWLGFGTTVEVNEEAYYSGHSFCVSKEFLELVPSGK